MEEIFVDNVDVDIGNKKIIENINLVLNENSFVGIIGPNGSGKSTLLKSIYRVLKPSGGKIFLQGEDIEKISYRDSAKKLAVVSQSNDINFDFTVIDMVLLGRSPYKKILESDNEKDFEIADNALRVVGMETYRDRIFTTLSGGEKQRVLFARALCQDTDCLILDEPTNHLDIKHQIEILKLVKKLNISTIMAIHDLNFALNYCDYLYALKDGKLVGEGEPENLLTEEFIEDVYEVKSDIYRINGKIVIAYDN